LLREASLAKRVCQCYSFLSEAILENDFVTQSHTMFDIKVLCVAFHAVGRVQLGSQLDNLELEVPQEATYTLVGWQGRKMTILTLYTVQDRII